jgi:hypothetical protein
MKAHLVVIIITALAAVTCGVTFLLALLRQFGLVEVTASLGAGAEVSFELLHRRSARRRATAESLPIHRRLGSCSGSCCLLPCYGVHGVRPRVSRQAKFFGS